MSKETTLTKMEEHPTTSASVKTHSLPPMFGDNFVKGNYNWKRLNDVEFDQIGRILACHLIIEHYLNKLLELRLPKHIDTDAANLNFGQKLKMLRNDHALSYVDFYQGVTIINKIRNKFSHYLEAKIDDSEIGILISIQKAYNEKNKDRQSAIPDNNVSQVVIIETFTSLFCAFLGGYCTALVDSTI